MNTLINGIFKRDMALAFRQRSELAQPLMFLLMVITLFPLGIGPGPVTLQKIGPGVIWIAAILSSHWPWSVFFVTISGMVRWSSTC